MRLAFLLSLAAAAVIFPVPAARAADPPEPLLMERAFPALSFTNLSFITNAGDGTGRLFAGELFGWIEVFADDQNVATKSVFLDMQDRMQYVQVAEEGLVGMVFDPAYKTNGFFYVFYTAVAPQCTDSARCSILSRFSVGPDPNFANRDSERRVLEIPRWSPAHHGGGMVFGPDGMLYVGVGDGGTGPDPEQLPDPMGNGQKTGTLQGKVLRIDVRTLPYTVPSDNPFVGREGYRPEIWAYGFRNPWGLSFDPVTGDLWVADVGHKAREEINVITKGGNYGWSTMEGTICTPPVASCDQAGFIPPVFEYAHGAGDCAIIGGFVYRGRRVPELTGTYVMSDFCSGRVRGGRSVPNAVTGPPVIGATPGLVSAIGQDERGEPYFAGFGVGGGIYRLAGPRLLVSPIVYTRLTARVDERPVTDLSGLRVRVGDWMGAPQRQANGTYALIVEPPGASYVGKIVTFHLGTLQASLSYPFPDLAQERFDTLELSFLQGLPPTPTLEPALAPTLAPTRTPTATPPPRVIVAERRSLAWVWIVLAVAAGGVFIVAFARGWGR